jgi:uncharacterized protein (UPF0332 family)
LSKQSEIDSLIQKAYESLAAAELLLMQGYLDFAASRGYYAMFYATEAALLSQGLSFSKHTGVIAAFGKEFAKPRRVPRHFHRYLLDAFDVRLVGDYGVPGAVSKVRASEVLSHATAFIQAIEDLLGSESINE